jgi:NAD(P)-dependent dehydrogenase (short-subunit alcohol dehydrogenase family)
MPNPPLAQDTGVTRVALVTGAAQRIGRAIALELAAHGWAVAVHYRSSTAAAAQAVAMLREAGAQAIAFQADLADEAACNALVPAVRGAFGRIDAVVNNASLFEHDDVASFGHAAMERAWRANTAPAILLARALHASVSEPGSPAGSGAVVNLLDQKLWNPNPDHLSYTLSKAALQAATTVLAQALAPAVRVCGVAPGLTLGSSDIDEQRLVRLQSQGLLKRGTSAEDVARSVRFLLENPSITGSTLLVDAGNHLQPAARDFAFQPVPAP